MCTNGERIIRKTKDADLIDVISKQHFFAQMRLSRIMYGKVSRLAEAWNISDGVVINPAVNYGKPVVSKTGLSTFIVSRQYSANSNDAEFVAKMFNVSAADVLHAVQFEGSLGQRAA